MPIRAASVYRQFALAKTYPLFIYANVKSPNILQSATDVSKSNSTDEQHASNPGSHAYTFECEGTQHQILASDCMCRCVGHV